MGLQIATTLHHLAIPFVLVELDQRRVEQAQRLGYAVVYGDASHSIVLEAARVEQASLLVVTIPGIVESRAIIAHTQRHNDAIQTIARLSDPDFLPVFTALQVTELIYPELEAGLEMARQVLLALGIPVTEIQRQTESLRQEYFASSISDTRSYRTLSQFRAAEQQFDLQWVTITATCRLAGRTIGESEVRKKTGVSVVGVLRDDRLEANPHPAFRLADKDMVAIIGSGDARTAFHDLYFAPGPVIVHPVVTQLAA